MQVNRTPQCYNIIAYVSQQNITSRLLVPRTDTHCPMSIRVRVLNCNNQVPPQTIRLPTAYYRISAYSLRALPPSSSFQPQRNIVKYCKYWLGPKRANQQHHEKVTYLLPYCSTDYRTVLIHG